MQQTIIVIKTVDEVIDLCTSIGLLVKAEKYAAVASLNTVALTVFICQCQADTIIYIQVLISVRIYHQIIHHLSSDLYPILRT